MTEPYDVVVLGGGGAGLMCAATAAARGLRVIVLERSHEVGRKIVISGGGRCNFTNIGARAENYLSQNPHFIKSALGRYSAHDFLALVETYKIAWHEKTLGQLFCDGSAKQIVAMLLEECAKGNVKIATSHMVEAVAYHNDKFFVSCGKQEIYGRNLVIATGGLSIPKLGASDLAYHLARQFGLKVVEPRPALVPLTLGGDEVLFRELSGVSAEVIAFNDKANFREAALFTHKGLSGPAILQISSYWRSGESLNINFLPDKSAGWMLDSKRSSPQRKLSQILCETLPTRLVDKLCERLGVGGLIGDVSDKRLAAVESTLSRWAFNPNGTEGFAKAEVTVGGVSTAELSSKTMEAKKRPNLYFIGEAVDVTGWLGGYNFQWAWSSGVAAGEAIC